MEATVVDSAPQGARASERVAQFAARWVAAGKNVYAAKEPPFDPRDGGVPPAMWADEPDAFGWVRWRAIEGAVRPEDLLRFETAVGTALPAMARAWMTTRSLGPIETPELRLSALFADAPLAELEADLEAWAPLHEAGFLVIGDAVDVGPLCLDLGRAQGGDCPVVSFEAEALLRLGAAGCRDRARLSALAQLRAPTFAALLDSLR